MRRAADVHQALEIMDGFIDRCWETRDRRGYFAALYRGVTRRVVDDIGHGTYDDGDRMSRFDAAFANRWFEAIDAQDAAGRPTRAWRLSFEACRNPRVTIVQHLLLGMNAHINLDLGVSAAQVAHGDALAGLFADFEAINTLLNSMLDQCQALIARHSPMMRLIDISALRLDEAVANFSIRRARQAAWANAQHLAWLEGPAHARAVTQIDRHAGALARLVADPGMSLGAVLAVVRAWESTDVRDVIETLATLGGR